MADLRNQSPNQAGDTSVLTDTVITITGILSGSNELEIEGGPTSIAYSGKKVRWVINTNEVSEIYLILPEHDPSKVFDAKPDKQSGEWEGKIKSKGDFPYFPFSEKYTIIYKKAATGSKLYIYDPIIQVNT